MEQLYTRWKAEADFEHPEKTKEPLPEYPGPQLRRKEYQILVPFSPETALSGVGRPLQPGFCSTIREQKVYGYKHFKTEKELEEGYERMIRREILPNIKRGLSASVLTQTSDVEGEINGLLTWDREVLKIPAATIRRLNRLIQKEFEKRTEGNYGSS